ncbi:MAG: GDSL-type esterase/lipase family protein [Planctomycetes bacterium]|nr:GDSL-type esterase/lipase family protein [Planctomycetota bacterium]
MNGSGNAPPPAPAPPAVPRRRGTWKKAAASAALTALLLVLCLEVVGRATPLLGPEITLARKLTEPDPVLGKRLRPGTYGHIEIRSVEGLPPEVGLRDEGPGTGSPRILALGDSFTFNDRMKAADVWTEVLQRSLGFPVVNAGMGGSGPEYARRFLAAHGFALKPDLVLFCFFSGNDVIDSGMDAGISVRSLGTFRNWLHEHSVTYRAAKAVARRISPMGSDAESRVFRKSVGGVDHGFWPSLVELNCRPDPPASYAEALEAAQAAILGMKEECGRRGVPFAVAVFPFKEQVYFDAVREWLKEPSRLDPDRPGSSVAALCRAKGIPVLDLTRVFRESRGRDPYLAFDGHWNEEGNRIAAAALEPFVRPLLPRRE